MDTDVQGVVDTDVQSGGGHRCPVGVDTDVQSVMDINVQALVDTDVQGVVDKINPQKMSTHYKEPIGKEPLKVNKQIINYHSVNNQEREKEPGESLSPATPLEESSFSGQDSSEQSSSPNKTQDSQGAIISQADAMVEQAFNKFCEVYPKLGDRNQAHEAFVAIPDIHNICWKIVQSVEWFEKSRRWDNWSTHQKNVSCPWASKFLQRGDWQEYMKSGDAKPDLLKERMKQLKDVEVPGDKIWEQLGVKFY